MRWVVCGSRHLGKSDWDGVANVLDDYRALLGTPALIMHGGARGADAIAADWAEWSALDTQAYPAEWQRLGRKAGPARNQAMADKLAAVDECVCIAFPLVGAENRGTWDMVRRAGQAGAIVYVHPVTRKEASE